MNKTVLIVEDNESFAETLSEVLKARGFVAQWVRTLKEAVLRAENVRFDLAIVDHGLDRESGFDVASELDRCELVERFVFLTGKISVSEREIPENLRGRALVLHKPIELDDLVNTLNTLFPS